MLLGLLVSMCFLTRICDMWINVLSVRGLHSRIFWDCSEANNNKKHPPNSLQFLLGLKTNSIY